MERKYIYVKSFDGEVCSKQVGDQHKLKVTNLPVNQDIKEKYFGDYSFLIYFLPDQTLGTDTLKDDLQTWIFGPKFRSQMKNAFEDLDIIDFKIE